MTFADRMQRNAHEFRPGHDASEYSWGTGLVPRGLEDAPPHEGGRYRGLSPEMTPEER